MTHKLVIVKKRDPEREPRVTFLPVEQAFVGREEIRAPQKTPAWEAKLAWTRSPIA